MESCWLKASPRFSSSNVTASSGCGNRPFRLILALPQYPVRGRPAAKWCGEHIFVLAALGPFHGRLPVSSLYIRRTVTSLCAA